MGWWGESFTVASSTLPVILFASGSSYAVHVLGRYYLLRAERSARPTRSRRRCASSGRRCRSPPAPPRSASSRSSPPTCGRCARSASPAARRAALLVTSLTLVPAVVALWPRKAHQEVQLERARRLRSSRMWHWAQRHRRLLVRRRAALGALTVGPMLRVRVRMEPQRVLPRRLRAVAAPSAFSIEHFGGPTFAQVWLSGDFDDPSTLRELARLEDFARSLARRDAGAVGARRR